MKLLSFLRRLLPGRPSPAPAPPAAPRPDIYFEKYLDLLIQHNQALQELADTRQDLAETNQQYAASVREAAQLDIENANLRLILSGNYRTDHKPDPIY